MIDAVLYGYNPRGRLRLLECRFHSLKGLAFFFACSRRAIPWEWAEVTTNRNGKPRVARYSRDELRSLVERSGSSPSPN